MKIYFAGAIRAGRRDAAVYHQIILELAKWGAVLTEHVGNLSLTRQGDDGPDDRAIHRRDMAWLKQSDVVIAEVTVPSLGVGYELGIAAARHLPILCLYRHQPDRPLSAMISGCDDIRTEPYSSLEQARTLISRFITKMVPPPTSDQGAP